MYLECDNLNKTYFNCIEKKKGCLLFLPCSLSFIFLAYFITPKYSEQIKRYILKTVLAPREGNLKK